MLSNYNYFILEKCISDVIKEYTEIIYNLYKNFGLKTIKHDFNNKDFKLKNCKITFTNSGNSYFTVDNCISEKEYISGFVFHINVNDIKSNSTHELLHAKEFYDIKKKNILLPFYDTVKKALISTNNQENTPFKVFRNFIYITLDNELNARIAQIYPFLISLQTNNYKILKKELELSEIFKTYWNIKSFDSIRMYKYLIKRLNIQSICYLINELNSEIKDIYFYKKQKELDRFYIFINDLVNDENDVINYFNKWNKLFKLKANKHIQKLYDMIDVVIIDYNDKKNYKVE